MKSITKKLVALLCMMAIIVGTCATTSFAFAEDTVPEGLEEGSVAVTVASHSASCNGAGAFLLDSTYRDRRNAMSNNCNYTSIQRMQFNGQSLSNWILFNGEPITFDVHMRSENLDFYSIPSSNDGDTIEFVKGMPFPYMVSNETGEVLSGHPTWPAEGTYTIKWKDYLGEGYKVEMKNGTWVKVAAAGSVNAVKSASAVSALEADEVNPALVTFNVNFDLEIVSGETSNLEKDEAYANNIYLNGKSIAEINAADATKDAVTMTAYLTALTVNVKAESAVITADESFEFKIGKDFVSTTGMIMAEDYVRHYLPELAYWSTVAPFEPETANALRLASVKDFEMIDGGANGAFDFNFTTAIASQSYLFYNCHPEYLVTLPGGGYQPTMDAGSELAAGGYLASLLEHVEINGKTLAQMWAESTGSPEQKSSMYQIHILGSTLSVRSANTTFNTDRDMAVTLKAGLIFYEGNYLENDIKVVYTAADGKTVYTVDTQSVEVTAEQTTLEVGEETQLTATLTPSDATGAVTYASDNTAVATVDETGKVTAVSAGTAVITATSGGKSGSVTITVNAAVVPATGITLSADKTTVTAGKDVQLTATVTPEGSTDAVTYESSDTTVATVDENGKVTTLKAGTVTITAKAGDQTATVTITVQAASDPDVDSGCEDGCQNAAGSLVMVLALGAFLIVRKR